MIQRDKLDVVSLSLTKSIGCPIGSLLVGPKNIIDKARRMRQMLGGGCRQAGIVGLENWERVIDSDDKKQKN